MEKKNYCNSNGNCTINKDKNNYYDCTHYEKCSCSECFICESYSFSKCHNEQARYEALYKMKTPQEINKEIRDCARFGDSGISHLLNLYEALYKEANSIISEKDNRIKELEDIISQNKEEDIIYTWD